MCCPAALFAFAPSAFSRTVAAPPFCRSVNDYCCIILNQRLPPPSLHVSPPPSVVRNVAPRWCASNLFLPGTLPNSYTRGFNLTPPNWLSISLHLTESLAPVAFVSLSTITAMEQPLTSLHEPRSHTPCSWPKLELTALTTLPCHSQRRTIFESGKQNP